MGILDKKAFRWSLAAHTLALGGLFLFTSFRWFKEKEPIPHVFELVSPPAAVETESAPRAPEPEIRDMETDFPKPGKRNPQPDRHPQPRKITFDEFKKKHGPPPEPQSPPQAPQPAVNVKEIDVSGIRQDLRASLADERTRKLVGRMSAAEQDAFASFKNAVKEQINRAWKKPAVSSGRELEAVASFVAAPGRRISEVEIVRSSGNEAFDASVRDAFDSAGPIATTPNAAAYRLTLTFRMVE